MKPYFTTVGISPLQVSEETALSRFLMLEDRDLCPMPGALRYQLSSLRQASGLLCGSFFSCYQMGIVIPSLPTLQEHCRIRDDDKCMRSVLKTITHYANMRDCQISHLSFLLSALAFLETRQYMQKPWLTPGTQQADNLWELSQAYAFDLAFDLEGQKSSHTHLHISSSPPPFFSTSIQLFPKIEAGRKSSGFFPFIAFFARQQLSVCFVVVFVLPATKLQPL